MELIETRLKNNRVRDKKENKGAADYFGENLDRLLNLVQVIYSKDFPPVWEALAQATKHQQLLVLQRGTTVLDDAEIGRASCSPIVLEPRLYQLHCPQSDRFSG